MSETEILLAIAEIAYRFISSSARYDVDEQTQIVLARALAIVVMGKNPPELGRPNQELGREVVTYIEASKSDAKKREKFELVCALNFELSYPMLQRTIRGFAC
jgi:hypothetical protein